MKDNNTAEAAHANYPLCSFLHFGTVPSLQRRNSPSSQSRRFFFLSLSPFFFGLPLPPPTARSPLSVAAVLVMAVCPWCKLAVGSQVARVTVIDVQVFSSSHTETPEQHTHSTHIHTHAEAQYACIHPIVVHMQVVVYLHNYAH